MAFSCDSAVFRCQRPSPRDEDPPEDQEPASCRRIIPAGLRDWLQQLDEPDRPPLQTLIGSIEDQDNILHALLADNPPTLHLTYPAFDAGTLLRQASRVCLPGCDDLGLPVGLPWHLFWGSVFAEPFVVLEPLRSHVDDARHTISDLHRLLWEARFMIRENVDPALVQDFGNTAMRWAAGEALTETDVTLLSLLRVDRKVIHVDEKIDTLGLLTALARQNDFLERMMIVVKGLDIAVAQRDRASLQQLVFSLTNLQRWVKDGGFPLGIVALFDFDKDGVALRRMNPKLHALLERGMSWI